MSLFLKKRGDLLLACFVAAGALWAAAVSGDRAQNEATNATVELCLDAAQIAGLCNRYRTECPDFLERCRKEGVTAVALGEESLATLENDGMIEYNGRRVLLRSKDAVEMLSRQLESRYHLPFRRETQGTQRWLAPDFLRSGIPPAWNRELPVGPSPEKIRFFSSLGFRLFMRPENAGDVRWIGNATLPVAGCIIDGKEAPGFPGREAVAAAAIDTAGFIVIPVEFSAPSGCARLKECCAGRLVLGHTVLQQEINRTGSTEPLIHRWVRAVKERGSRFLIIRLWDQKSAEENLGYLAAVTTALRRERYVVGPVQPPVYPSPGRRSLRLKAAVSAGFLFPLIGLFLSRQWPEQWWARYLLMNAVSLAGGLVIAALLYDVYFMQKIAEVPAVKAMLLLPFLASVLMLFPGGRLRAFGNTPVTVNHLAVAFFACAAAAIALVRSGNTSLSWLHPDQGIRQLVENMLIIRPRTKEFLVGQPLLIAGLYFKNPALIWLGMIGQVSIINTFFHAHSPVVVSLLRTLNGIWTGAVLGVVLVLAVRAERYFRGK